MNRPSKYYIRIMRPIFQRALFTVEAESQEAAIESALTRADRLTEQDWTRLRLRETLPLPSPAMLS